MPSLRTSRSSFHSRVWRCVVAAMLLTPLALAASCGPGLVAAGGGSVGAIFGLQGSGDDDKKDGGGSNTPTTNVAPAVVVTALVREESPARIQYTILDANSDACSVEVQYSVGGGSFQNCLEGSGPGDGTTGLATSPAGTSHTFSWDFATDEGLGYLDDVTIRVRANDGQVTSPWSELTGQDIGNDGPEVLSMVPPPNGLRIIPIEISLADTSSDIADITVAYSIDQGQNFTIIDSSAYLGGGPVNLLTSPAGNSIQFFWIAENSEPDFVGEVILVMQAADQPSGYSDVVVGTPFVASPFIIDTSINGPPTLQLLSSFDGKSFVGRVPISVALSDNESDASAVVVQFTLDDGVNWQPCTLVSQFSQGIAGPFSTQPSPTSYEVVWDALPDLAAQIGGFVNSHPQVRLALFAADSQAGNIVVSDDFSLFGNSAPAVTSFQVFQDSGNVPLNVTVTDANSDPVSVTIEYSTDGSTYFPLSQGDFVFGNLSNLESGPFGADNVLIWNTNIALLNQNHAGVTIRLIPTDHPPSATPVADLSGPNFVSASFPIINNAAASTPTSITVITWDGVTPNADTDQVTVLPSGTIELDRFINPAGAEITFNTLWKIFEQDGDYGSLINGSHGTQSMATGVLEVLLTATDGDLFQIDDGFNGVRTFEFDTNSVIVIGHTPVPIGTVASSADVAAALVAAINQNDQVRIDAVVGGPGVVGTEILLTHQIGCRLGNHGTPGANAAAMSFSSATAGNVVSQMSGGVGTKRVLYQAPAAIPGGSQFVTLVCEIDDPLYFTSVQRIYRIYWGDAPTTVLVSPTAADVAYGSTASFASLVQPSGANQSVTWEVQGTGNGSITHTGSYIAPAGAPNVNPVTVIARSVVNPAVFGTAQVTLYPLPTSVVVTPVSTSGPGWSAPDLNLNASTTFGAEVFPGGAPQGVTWHILWNSTEFGLGNSTVGTLTVLSVSPPRVQYTAPHMPLAPDVLQIRAVSDAKVDVIGSYQVKLIAPAPTSFTLSPSTATVSAGGAGVQFTPTNFVPTNANQSVTWSISGVGQISALGFYTPPATVVSPQNVLVTASSIPTGGTVFATASVTVNPATAVTPSSITITPSDGVCASGGAKLFLVATVLPSGAPQGVTWTFVGTGYGMLNATTGEYEPPNTPIDREVTIRATSNFDSGVTRDVDICISGNGQQWQEVTFNHLGRGDATTLWDATNDIMWVVGGRSEGVAMNDHDPTPLWVDFSGAQPVAGGGPTIGGGTPFSSPVNTISAAVDTLSKFMYAIVGQGSLVDVEVWRLDLQAFPTATWQPVTFTPGPNVPRLANNVRHHTWYDPDSRMLMIMLSNTQAYQFNLDALSGSFHSWVSPQTLSGSANSPTSPQLCGMAYNPADKEYYFVGPDSNSGGANLHAYKLNPSGWGWSRYTSLGKPSGSISNPCLGYDQVNDRVWVYSGSGNLGLSYSTDLHYVELGTVAQWTSIPTFIGELRPTGRGESMIIDAQSRLLMFGGLNARGTFGDLWEINRNSGGFSVVNAENLRPQGRAEATGAMDSGVAYVYGGLCDHGVSDELWSMTYNRLLSRPEWLRVTPTGMDQPPRLWGARMVHDSSNDVYLMFGGDGGVKGASAALSNAVYVYDPSGNSWTLLTPGGTPPAARRNAAVAYDEDRECLWVFGGEASTTSRFDDLWRLNLSGGLGSAQWVLVTQGGNKPSPREGSLLGYDDKHGNRLWLLGGNAASSGNRQLYEFTINTGQWDQRIIDNTGNDESVYRSQGHWIGGNCPRFIHLPAAVKKAQGVVMTSNGPWWQYMASPPTTNNATAGVGLYDRQSGTYIAVLGERSAAGRTVGVNGFRKFELE